MVTAPLSPSELPVRRTDTSALNERWRNRNANVPSVEAADIPLPLATSHQYRGDL
jgi:hypothetical protein